MRVRTVRVRTVRARVLELASSPAALCPGRCLHRAPTSPARPQHLVLGLGDCAARTATGVGG